MSRARWLAAAALLAAAATLPRAAVEPLPVVRPLDLDRVEISLHRGRVDIVVDPGQVPTLRVSDLRHGEETEGFVLLEPLSDGLVLGQPHGAEDLAPPLAVEVVVSPGQRVRVDGSDIAVTVRGADVPPNLAEPGDAEGEPLQMPTRAPRGASPGPRTDLPIVLELTGGTLALEGVRDVVVTARDTGISLSRTIGEIDLAVTDAVVEVREHRGPLLLGGERTEYELIDSRVAASVRLDEGLLVVTGGDGRVIFDGTRSDAQVTGWSGALSVRGSEQRIEVGDSGTANETLKVDGIDQEITVDNWSGAIVADMTGGRMDVRRIGGAVTLKARTGALARIEQISDELELKLDDGASADVERIGRRLRARLDSSRLDAVDVRELDLRAKESFVVVEKVFGRTKATFNDSEGDLDFVGIHASPNVEANGTSSVRIVMSEPCSVRGAGGGSRFAELASISGCQVLTSDRRRPVIRSRTAKPPTVLALSIDDLASVDVRTRP